MKNLSLYSSIILIAFFISIGCTAKQTSDKQTISVSIAPIAYLTQRIVDGDFTINTLVPYGSSPETYEPTVLQMKDVANSIFYFNIGLIDFEKNLNEAIARNMPNVRSVRLDRGITLIEGGEGDEEDKGGGDEDDSEEDEGHHHGTDPHIWNAPKSLKIMAENIYTEIHGMYPYSSRYTANYERLTNEISQLDTTLDSLFANKNIGFLIYHPALSYLARDYGLTQIPIENEGKEPSVEDIKQLISVAKNLNINKIFYQQQFSSTTVKAIAAELGIEAVAIDPLAYDIINNTLYVSELIAE